ncbi:MAG: magnesium-dependent phosphatase-1 [Deltaproteobacteria bacterium]|nr:magnesium-dependent phosphatase-1 [Deltaproteobacteria bacterium]
MTLLVFDLDFTLWDAGGTWCDHTRPPYRIRNGKVLDMDNSHIRLYPDVLPVLCELHQKNVPMAIASRTGEPSWARELMGLLNIQRYFKYEEIYPTTKTRHFKQLANQSGKAFSDMIFFDDEYRNIQDVAALGVKAVHVPKGLTRKIVMDALMHSPRA